MNWSASGSGNGSGGFSLDYSLNNGGSWSNAAGMSLSNSSQSSSFDVVLSNGQDLTQVQVKMSLGGGGGPGVNFNANASITNIRIEVETDTTPPVISNVAAGGITASGATITWTTNENSDSQVEYGPTTAYGQSTTLNPALVTAHSQGLSGLTAGTLYHYRVKSRDAAGNLAVSGDFTFTTAPDTTPPTVASFSPAAGATNVSPTANVVVTFSEAMDAATVNGSTVELRDPSNALVSATVSYNAASLTAILNPTASLAAGVTYTARVRGGGTDPRVKDVAGNALAADVTWTFTTAQSGSGGIKWLVTDHLGSTRMVIDETGSLSGIERHDFAPFGEELFVGVGIRSASNGYGGDSVRQKFTGYERDETGFDFAQARYFASLQGRFTSPDSVSGRLSNPQTLNLYAYVHNNPLAFVDPTGHFSVDGGYGPLTSTHTDNFGNVVAVYNDGDFGVYLHESLAGWDRKSKLPTHGPGVIRMGYTLCWDEFAYLDKAGNPVEGYQADRKKRGRIMFGESWDPTVEDIHEAQLLAGPELAAQLSRNGQLLDIKENREHAPYGHFTGKRMTITSGLEVFVSAKSVGNFMVGHYAAWIGLSKYTIINLAGALQQKQWRGRQTGIDILLGKTFGPPPYYGETEYAGKMIEVGHLIGGVEKAGFRIPR